MNVIETFPGIIHIEENYRVYCTLIRGASQSILWDTGTGKLNLRPYTEQRGVNCSIVLNSHGHADHTGGNGYFERVYLAKEDWLLSDGGRSANIVDLRPGQVFELGDDTAQTVCLAGHTHGSLGLLLSKRRLLLAGDALDPRLQLLGEEACTPGILKSTFERALSLPFDRYLIAHSPSPLDKTQIEAHREHLEKLDAKMLKPVQRAGVPVWISAFRDRNLRSEFIFGESVLERINSDEDQPFRSEIGLSLK